MNWLIFLGMSAVFFLVTAVAISIAPRGIRKVILVLVLLGLLGVCLKIFIFQHTPQWHDALPDAVTYDLNARAFEAHWAGNTVGGQDFHLRGLLAFHAAGIHGLEWQPDDALTYAWVVGSHEWLYPCYVALWYWLSGATSTIVIWSNALWAALFPAAAFGIAYFLGAGRRVAVMAAGFALIDPSAGVNASWLLKDTLAGFLAMSALWALLGYIKVGGKLRLVIVFIALSFLGGIRLAAFLGLAVSACMVSIWLIFQRTYLRKGLSIVIIVLCAWLMQGVFSLTPHVASSSLMPENSTISLLSRPTQVLFNGVEVLQATSGNAVDDSVLTWTNSVADGPAYAVFRSVARTLFAPYPWTALSPGLTWNNYIELYYPGVVLWLVALPGIFIAFLIGFRQKNIHYWLVLLFLLSQLAAYTIWLGEWSTRQRVFALPVFFALSAVGWERLISWSIRGRHILVKGVRLRK